MEFSAQRVRSKTRVAVRRREEQIEMEEMESGELNLIPYLDMITNLMLFLLASVSAGLILTQIDTTLPDKASGPAKQPDPGTKPEDQPLKLVVSIDPGQMILWSFNDKIDDKPATLQNPWMRLPSSLSDRNVGADGKPCDGAYMCQSNQCGDPSVPGSNTCFGGPEGRQLIYDYHALNKQLYEIAKSHYLNKTRKKDSYTIVLQADASIPYSVITSTMAAMRCKLPDIGSEVKQCSLPSDDENLKKAADPFSKERGVYDTERAKFTPDDMALFSDIQFSPGFYGGG